MLKIYFEFCNFNHDVFLRLSDIDVGKLPCSCKGLINIILIQKGEKCLSKIWLTNIIYLAALLPVYKYVKKCCFGGYSINYTIFSFL
jgi:hypothetical protein